MALRIASLEWEELPERRIVLVGKTGAGKSASGNTLLGKKAFTSEMSSGAVTSKCKKERAEFEGQSLAVIDTPGLFDTHMTQEVVKREIAKCISFAAPGPHVFLVVIKLGRFTEEEQQTVKIIQMLFGEKASEYTMVLFTHGDDLEYEETSIETFISGNPSLLRFVSQCHGGYHVFNNRKRTSGPEQVRALLMKIHLMVQRNGGRCFTNEMLQEAERIIREKIMFIIRETPQITQGEARQKAENDDRTLFACMTSGALAGSVGGLVGAAVGAAAGFGMAALSKLEKGSCTIQ